MKWYNEDKTKMLDLNSISGYVFISAEEYIKHNSDVKEISDFKDNGDRLEIIMGGTPFIFRGNVAKEIFDLLKSNELGVDKKELLEG